MEAIKFSIITISYNHAEFIEDTIRSVQAQNYSNVEHIVIDGGSTDDTITILKKYPHLNWTSERDRGISHALNKGLQKATGDIIAWINSDDWYAPNIFCRVAELHRQGNHIIMGDAIETDRAGTPVRTIQNHPRSRADIQKYWVPLAWLAQPSIFFSRAALESVKFPNGDYIDESYNYSMDYDLWLRFAEQFPFTCSVNEVFSYFRIYGENATGRAFASPQRELGRAFRRSMMAQGNHERTLSLVIPIESLGADLGSTLTSLFEQTQKGFDILLVDGCESESDRKTIKDAVAELEEATTEIGFRHIKKRGFTFNALIQAGIEEARSPLFAVLQPGDALTTGGVAEIISLFAHDVYGVALFLQNTHQTYGKIIDQKTALLNPHTLLDIEDTFLPFAARTMVAQEVGSYEQTASPFVSFLMRAFNRGWLLTNRPEVQFTHTAPSKNFDSKTQLLLSQYIKADLFSAGFDDVVNDIFYPIRSQSGYTLAYQPEQVKRAKEFLSILPPTWRSLSSHSPLSDLQECVTKFPLYAPGWFFLAEAQKAAGDTAGAAASCEALLKLRPDLK